MANDLRDADMIHAGVMKTSVDASEAITFSNTVSMTPRARLPPELWAMTVNAMRNRTSQAELAYLWTIVRRVSKDFEQEIEKLFLNEYIGKTWIHADCGYRCVECRTFRRIDTFCRKKVEGSDRTHIRYSDFGNAGFRFRNLDMDDDNRAIFKYSLNGKPDHEDSQHSVLNGLLFRLSNKDKENPPLNSRKEDEATTAILRSRCILPYEKLPIFVVQVRNSLIDSEVPAFRLDIENQGISVDWRALFTNYFLQYLAGVRQKETDAALPVVSDDIARKFQHMNTIKRNLSCLARIRHRCATRASQYLWIRQQIRAYRKSCGDLIQEKDDLSAGKLRKRRIAD